MAKSRQAELFRGVLLLSVFVVIAAMAVLLGAPKAGAETLTVTSNADSGPGTLRAAVDSANANPSQADTITFDLPQGQRTITLSNQITFKARPQTTVDGTDQGVTVSGGGNTRVFDVVAGNLAVINLTVANGDAGDGNGGGINNQSGILSVTGSTISGNTASYGGGIYSSTRRTGSKTAIANSTISGNTANYGGGVVNQYGQTTIRSTTVTRNSAPQGQGAGVASYGAFFASTAVGSSIIAANDSTDVDVIPGPPNTFTSEGHNVIGSGNATGAFDKPGDQVNVPDPKLGPLADNGGPTETHALLSGSSAIDRGDTTLTTDQRGYARPADGDRNGTVADDSGSFELQTVSAPPPPSERCTITGTEKGDALVGTPRRDVICGRGGNDAILGLGGDDLLKGGAGNDAIFGGAGSDALLGGAGSDVLLGGPGKDTLKGGPGNDRTRQ